MKKTAYIFALCLSGLFVFSGCTDSFERDNAIKGSFSEELKQIDNQKYSTLFDIVQSGIYFNYNFGSGVNWTYQLTQALQHDMYSGYFHDQVAKFNDKNSVYNINTGWSDPAWDYTYQYILPITYNIDQLLAAETTPLLNHAGINSILRVMLMHRIADTYGPIVYSKFGSSEDNIVDTQKEAYYAFFADLDKGVENLTAFLNGGGAEEASISYDMMNLPTISSWIKYANSLRLRLAIRISNVDKAKAQMEATKALTNSYGLLETASDIVQVSGKNYANPQYTLASVWGEVFMGASIASLLNGYDDPRRSLWFSTSKIAGHENEWVGVPQGVLMREGDPNYFGVCSSFIGYGSMNSPAILMTAAEVWFLRAEAALRGFSTENVQNCYETGVKTSFTQWGADKVDEYLQSDKTPADYVCYVNKSDSDPTPVAQNMSARISISPKWDASASNEVKLEHIITQKWLAVFPESYEAWSEQRRTGYPKLFKVQTNNSGGAIDTDIMIRRLPHSVSNGTKDPKQYQYLKNALNGADNGGTRLWWDAGTNNF